jgi:hypothetical protein
MQDAGKGTLSTPFQKNPLLRLWTGKLPTNEFDDLILAKGIKLDSNYGYLTKESMKIASHVTIPHEAIKTSRIYRLSYKLAMSCIPMQNYLFATIKGIVKFGQRQSGRKTTSHSQRSIRILAETQFSPYRGVLSLSTSLLGCTRTEQELGRRKAQFRKKIDVLVRFAGRF